MSTEILYPQFEDDFDGFDEYVQCVSKYVLAHSDCIGEIVDIYDLVYDYVSQDDEYWDCEVDEDYLQRKYDFDESDLDDPRCKVYIITSVVRALLANRASYDYSIDDSDELADDEE